MFSLLLLQILKETESGKLLINMINMSHVTNCNFIIVKGHNMPPELDPRYASATEKETEIYVR